MLAEKLSGAVGNGTLPTYIEDVFSTWLSNGNSSTQNIVNGIDLSTKGGLVWGKIRSTTGDHQFFDTVRGQKSILFSNLTNAAYTAAANQITYNTDGFSWTGSGDDAINVSGYTYASWTFRKQPKFFDVVTWTGNGGTYQTISHSLGSVPGFIATKQTSTTGNWWCYHTSLGDSVGIRLNLTNASTNVGTPIWAPTSTTFNADSNLGLNDSGVTYVAYIFAHNAGGFGLTGTDNVISCGSYTGNGSSSGPTITLGYEPQWILVKGASLVQDWFVFDNMRGLGTKGASERYLNPNLNDAESSAAAFGVDITSTGFQLNTAGSSFNGSGQTYIYIAIRRGPMKVPTDATKVFAPVAYTGNGSTKTVTGVGFSPDLLMGRRNSASGDATAPIDRLRGVTQYLYTSATTAEQTTPSGNDIVLLNMDGFTAGPNYNANYNWAASEIVWNFRRAPSFFDEVCYTGNSTARNITHNLTVAPEMMIIKSRPSGVYVWNVYHSAIGTDGYIQLNSNGAATTGVGGIVFDQPQTTTTFSIGYANQINITGGNYVAWLFASCPGVSKVGSYTGNGSSQTINCGFAAGARFVLIKRTDSTGDWYVWDTARGIVSGNDPHLSLNTTAAEVTTDDTIDPDSSGFIVNQLSATNVNVSSATYIYLAIA